MTIKKGEHRKNEELDDDNVEVSLDGEEDLEIEIVDDTPPEDRNRTPLPEEIKKKLDEEDPEEVKRYSKEVEQRINQLKKAYHDERRRAEAAERQLEAAAALSRRLHKERQELRKRLSSGENWALSEAKRRAELEMQTAKAEYKAAYESGDPDKIAEAQSKIARATSHFDQIQRMRPQYALQDDDEQVYNDFIQQAPAAQQPRITPRDREWQKANPWFGSDPEMTSFAFGVHERLVREGVEPGSETYYERLDARIRQVFPDKFDDGEKHQSDNNGTSTKKESQRPSTVVAPVSRTPKGKKVVLTKSQVALARRLGVSPEDYAKELMASQSEE